MSGSGVSAGAAEVTWNSPDPRALSRSNFAVSFPNANEIKQNPQPMTPKGSTTVHHGWRVSRAKSMKLSATMPATRTAKRDLVKIVTGARFFKGSPANGVRER